MDAAAAAETMVFVKPTKRFTSGITARLAATPAGQQVGDLGAKLASLSMCASLAELQRDDQGAQQMEFDMCLPAEVYAEATGQPINAVLQQVARILPAGDITHAQQVTLLDGTRLRSRSGICLTVGAMVKLLDDDLENVPDHFLTGQQKALLRTAMRMASQTLTYARETEKAQVDHTDHTRIWNETIDVLHSNSNGGYHTRKQAVAQMCRIRGDLYVDVLGKPMKQICEELNLNSRNNGGVMQALGAGGRSVINFQTFSIGVRAEALRRQNPNMRGDTFVKKVPQIARSITKNNILPALVPRNLLKRSRAAERAALCRSMLLNDPKPDFIGRMLTKREGDRTIVKPSAKRP